MATTENVHKQNICVKTTNILYRGSCDVVNTKYVFGHIYDRFTNNYIQHYHPLLHYDATSNITKSIKLIENVLNIHSYIHVCRFSMCICMTHLCSR